MAGSVVVVFLWSALAAAAASAPHHGDAAAQVATLSQRDINGVERVSRQVVTRRSESSRADEVVIETYLPSMQEGRLALDRRVRRVTTTTSDGSQTVEETEARSDASPGDPMRVIKRSVTTVRTDASGVQITEQQLFELDVNGRFAPVLRQTEQKSTRPLSRRRRCASRHTSRARA